MYFQCTHLEVFVYIQDDTVIDETNPEEVGSVHVSFILNYIFASAFHVSLNSRKLVIQN